MIYADISIFACLAISLLGHVWLFLADVDVLVLGA